MLYLPGTITQAIIVVVSLSIISTVGYLGIRVYSLKSSLEAQKNLYEQCQKNFSQAEENNSFLKENIRILNEYENKRKRPKPPILLDGQFNIENVFPLPRRF